MRIVEDAQVLDLRRVGSTNLTWLHFELSLSQASALDQYLICNAPMVSISIYSFLRQSDDAAECDIRFGERSSSSIIFWRSGSACWRSMDGAIVSDAFHVPNRSVWMFARNCRDASGGEELGAV